MKGVAVSIVLLAEVHRRNVVLIDVVCVEVRRAIGEKGGNRKRGKDNAGEMRKLVNGIWEVVVARDIDACLDKKRENETA
jgi:hypothetical protein